MCIRDRAAAVVLVGITQSGRTRHPGRTTENTGINTAIVSPTGGSIGIGFAVPVNMARRVMDALIRDGKVTRGYLDIKTVVVSCGTCYDQLQGYKFEEIFPGCRIVDIHEYLLEKGITLQGNQAAYLYHDPCHSPMKQRDPMKTVQALVGPQVIKSERCCGESGTLGVTRPDISTQIRFRKEIELRQGETAIRALAPAAANVKILTSCPSCLQGLSRYGDDLQSGLLEADYIVVEMARQLLGEDWLPEYVARANAGGIERVLV